jgi:hypothetical protein
MKTKEPTGFDLFWAAYPRRIGKGAARKAWTRIKPDTQLAAKMLETIGKQKRTPQWKKDGGVFIPHPATWLNQERWEDDVEIDKPEPEAPPVNPNNQWRDPKTGRIWNRIDMEDLARDGKLDKDTHERVMHDRAPWGWML